MNEYRASQWHRFHGPQTGILSDRGCRRHSSTARRISQLAIALALGALSATGNAGVSAVTGGVTEGATDYRVQGAGGLEFGHYYNSIGQFRLPGSGPYVSGFADYWRFSYSRSLIAVTGNPQFTAVIQREDGTIEEFDGAGKEILNRDGAADKLTSSTGGWTLARGSGDVETYNSSGALTSITTRSGIVTTISYTNGKISQIADSFGHSLHLAYNANNQLSSVTLPDGSSKISYGYDSSGRLASVTYADATAIGYQYQDTYNSWLITGVVDENNQTYLTYQYTPQGVISQRQLAGGVGKYTISVGSAMYSTVLQTSVTDPLLQTRSYNLSNATGVYRISSSSPSCVGCPNQASATFDANGNYQSKSDLNWNQTTYTFDQARNLEISRTEGLSSGAQPTPATRTTTTQWHPTFRLPASISVYAGASSTGTPLRTTSYTYDGYQNVKTRTVIDGATQASRTWTYAYYNSGLYGQLQTVTGPRTDVSDVTTYTYYNCTSGKGCGQIQTIKDALGHVITYNAYNANGQPTQITDANAVVTTLAYDPRARLTDRCSNGLLPSCSGGELTHFDYWPTGLLRKVTLPDGSSLSYIYDTAHRLTEIDDALGNRQVYTLDAAGNRQQVQVYDASGNLTQAHTQLFNSVGQLWQDVASSGIASQATVYGYDSQGNQTNIAAPLSRTTINEYDALNRLSQVTDPNGGITLFAYDANDNLTSVTDPRTLKTVYTYNGLGDLPQIQSPDSGTTLVSKFDGAGNVVTRTDARGLSSTSKYDVLNRVTQVSYPDQTIGLSYDQGPNSIGRLSTLTDVSGQTAFSYDPLGRVTKKQQTIGPVTLSVGYVYQSGHLTSLTTPSNQSVVYSYDTAGRISGLSLNGSPLVSSIHYNPFGAVSGWTWGNGTVTARKYDLDARVTEIDSAGTSTYTFYDDGSISSRSDDSEHDYSVLPGTTTVSPAVISNQITSTSGALVRTYTYDAAGNTKATGSATYSYNAAGRMVSATQGSATAAFSVNGLGQRVVKSSGATTTLYAYDEAGHPLGEYTGSGALIQETLWLGDIPLATLRPNASAGVDIYYVHSDHLNTPRRVTRSTDNVVVWRWSSDPYGNGFVDEDPSGTGHSFTYNLRFPGQYFDAETGLVQNMARDYDPVVGRYLESDPIGLRGGSNSTYAYASDNPVSFADPSGLLVMVIGHVAASPLGKLTNPTSDHSALYLKPDDPCKCSGTWPVTLGAQKIGSNLVGAPNYPGDALSNAQFRQAVSPPAGMSDCDFIRALISAAASYQDNLPYSFPSIPSGAMPSGQYNSNSFVSGVLRAVGATPPSINTGGQFQLPGYQNPIPLPAQH